MKNSIQTIAIDQLSSVTGGQQKPQAPTPQPADETKWIKNAAKCARVGGPVLGALCGILTPTPAN